MFEGESDAAQEPSADTALRTTHFVQPVACFSYTF